MKDLFSVAGKVAVVTGGSNGIGAMITQGLVENGARVYITARKVEQLEATAAEMSKLGECIAIQSNLGTADGPAEEWTRAWRFRQPYRDEPGENTQLPAGETKSIEIDIPADAIAVEARVWYRLTPFVLDDSPMSTLLEERTLEL